MYRNDVDPVTHACMYIDDCCCLFLLLHPELESLLYYYNTVLLEFYT